MISKTLSPENQFKFTCPIFRVETKISACFSLRDHFWRGERPPVRVGCQCAMDAGKCPIPVVLNRMIREGTDPYHSVEPRVGKLDYDVLDRISRVLVTDATMKRYPLSAGETGLLLRANEDARNGVLSAPKKSRREERVVETLPDVAPAEKTTKSDASELMKAAASGDMTAAINAEVVDG